MTQTDWLRLHPYLKPLAQLDAGVNALMSKFTTAERVVPNWEQYTAEFHAGVPLLLSSNVTVDLGATGKMLEGLVNQLASIPLTQKLTEESRVLHAQLRRDPNTSYQTLTCLLYGEEFASPCSGLLRYLGWTTLAHHLRPLVHSFAKWRDEEQWLRSYCPGCGSLPCMAQLAGTDPGRRRFLSCTFCGTRWCYRRTGCPFCDNNDDRRLAILAAEGEYGVRIDTCESCGGYLKTYTGNGSEDFFLADWTSIHLDFVARDHGLKRVAASLYAL